MSLWNMSISGGVLIAVIVILRSLFRNRLPGKVFQVLWLAAFLRLMIPFTIPSQFSIYSLAEMYMEKLFVSETTENIFSDVNGEDMAGIAVYEGEDGGKAEAMGMQSLWMFLYPAGAAFIALYYIISYVKWHREFQTALPLEESFGDSKFQAWTEMCPVRRKVTIRQWEMTLTPLTYGIVHPVIVLPKSWRNEQPEQLRFMLLHEYMHIRHFDALKKMLLVLLCCIHWFNPLVWVMLVLANRDIELDCDAHVIRYLGGDMRAAYANTLIDMEEQKGRWMSWGNSFCKNAMEERVVAIMKEKKKPIVIGVLSGVLTAGIIMVFATSASAVGRMEQDSCYAEAQEGTAETAYYVDYINEAVASDTVSDASEQTDDTTVMIEEGETEDASVQIDDATAVAGNDEEVYADREQINETEVTPEYQEATAVASEQGIIEDVDVPAEYASYGITADAHTGAWKYRGKTVAVFYDKGRYLTTYDAPGEVAVYLEVRRNKKDEIQEIKELSKKKMQELLSHTGLVF